MTVKSDWRAGEFGVRPARIANCSGYHGMKTLIINGIVNMLTGFAGDPSREMYKQATLGDVDFITGDYLAGMFSSLAVSDSEAEVAYNY